MDVMGIIRLCVMIVVVIIMLGIYLIATAFAPIKPGIDNTPYKDIQAPLWRQLTLRLAQLLVIILVVMFMLWGFWRILKLLSPITFGITGLIAAIVPPFPQLKKAGIFQLFDEFIPSLVRLNLRGMLRALVRFYYKGGKYVIGNISGKSKSMVVMNKDGDVPKKSPPPKVVSGTGEDEDEDEEEEEEENRDATQASKYTPEEHKAVETKLTMCIAEKVEPVDPNAPFMDRMKTILNNNKETLGCQAQSIGQYNK